MKDRLSVESAIRLLNGSYSKQAERLSDKLNNYRLFKKAEGKLIEKMQKSFSDVLESFKLFGIVFPGVAFGDEYLDENATRLDAEIKTLEEERGNLEVEQTNYRSMDYEPGLNTFERREKLEEIRKKLDENASKLEELKAQREKVTLAKSERKDYGSFEYLSALYFDHKEEILGRLSEITDETVRIDVESEFEKIAKLIEAVKEKEVGKKAEIEAIEEIGKEIGIELVYDEELLASMEVKETKAEVVEEKQEEIPKDFEKTEEVKTESHPKLTIEDSRDLVAVLVSQNPGKKIGVNTREVNGNTVVSVSYDGPIDELALPNGFRYTEGLGVNNKVDDVTPYIALPLERKEEKKEVKEAEAPKAEPKLSSTFPSGRQHVKMTKSAVIDNYGKALFLSAGIGAIAIDVAALTFAPAVLTTAGLLSFIGGGAGLSAGIQKIYHKITLNSEERIQELEELDIQNPEKEVWTVPALAKLQNGIKKLIKSFPKIKKETAAKKEAKVAEIPDFTSATPEFSEAKESEEWTFEDLTNAEGRSM